MARKIARARVTRRDLPALCLLYAVIAAFGILLPYAGQTDIVERSALQSVSGQVVRIEHGRKGKLSIDVRAADGDHRIWSDDTTHAIPAMTQLQVGQSIDALVRPDNIGRDFAWLWELRRNGQLLLGYDDTYSHLKAAEKRGESAARIALTISMLLIAAGVAGRLYFGTWRDPASIKQPGA